MVKNLKEGDKIYIVRDVNDTVFINDCEYVGQYDEGLNSDRVLVRIKGGFLISVDYDSIYENKSDAINEQVSRLQYKVDKIQMILKHLGDLDVKIENNKHLALKLERWAKQRLIRPYKND